MPETWDIDKAALALADDDADLAMGLRTALTNHALAGKGIAIYENQDLGHPDIGFKIALTYGTPEAQFEPAQFPDGPPKQMPDGLARDYTGGINWRYQLIAIVPPVTHGVWVAETTD